jgi:bifunctional non-homologous end joining protein LigD
VKTKTKEVCQLCEKPFGGKMLICVRCRKTFCETCGDNQDELWSKRRLPWCKLCQGEKVLSDQERTVMEKVTLYCREGGSDKQYTIWIEEDQSSTKIDRWTVQAQWGRRGGTVQAGTKTPKPVARSQAEDVMEKILKEKRAKGYSEGPDAPAFKQVLGAMDSGLRPMLLTDATDGGEAAYIESSAWGAQEKMNGKRIMLDVFPDGRVVGVNRRGLECPIPETVVDAFKPKRDRRTPRLTLDGEMIGEVYHAFDLLLEDDDAGKEIDRKLVAMNVRNYRLAMVLKPFLNASMKFVGLVVPVDGKRMLVSQLRAGRKEGVVFKKLDAPYVPGKVENLAKATAVKVKFYSEGTFLVIAWNDKSSVQIAAYDDQGIETIQVGNVTVPAKYVDQINEAMGHEVKGKRVLIRVRYLYPDDAGCVVRDSWDQVARRSDLKLEGKDG